MIDSWRGMEGNSIHDAGHDSREIANQPVTDSHRGKALRSLTHTHIHVQRTSKRHSITMFQSIAIEMFPSSLVDSATSTAKCGAVHSGVASCFVRGGDE